MSFSLISTHTHSDIEDVDGRNTSVVYMKNSEDKFAVLSVFDNRTGDRLVMTPSRIKFLADEYFKANPKARLMDLNGVVTG